MSGIVLESGDISMSKTDDIPGILKSGRKIDLQQACMIFNTVALCAIEEKICAVYYKYTKIGQPGLFQESVKVSLRKTHRNHTFTLKYIFSIFQENLSVKHTISSVKKAHLKYNIVNSCHVFSMGQFLNVVFT